MDIDKKMWMVIYLVVFCLLGTIMSIYGVKSKLDHFVQAPLESSNFTLFTANGDIVRCDPNTRELTLDASKTAIPIFNAKSNSRGYYQLISMCGNTNGIQQIPSRPPQNIVTSGSVLYSQQYIPERACITSKNGHRFCLQGDGNIVLYDPTGKAKWSSKTFGRSGQMKLFMQNDGNLVGLDANNGAFWASRSYYGGSRAPYKLMMQDDGNAVIYDKNNTVIWTTDATKACGALYAPDNVIKMEALFTNNNDFAWLLEKNVAKNDGSFFLQSAKRDSQRRPLYIGYDKNDGKFKLVPSDQRTTFRTTYPLLSKSNIPLFTLNGDIVRVDSRTNELTLSKNRPNISLFNIEPFPNVYDAHKGFYALTTNRGALQHSNFKLGLRQFQANNVRFAWKLEFDPNNDGVFYINNPYNGSMYVGYDQNLQKLVLVPTERKLAFRVTPPDPISPMKNIILWTGKYIPVKLSGTTLSLKDGQVVSFDLYLGQDVYHNEFKRFAIFANGNRSTAVYRTSNNDLSLAPFETSSAFSWYLQPNDDGYMLICDQTNKTVGPTLKVDNGGAVFFTSQKLSGPSTPISLPPPPPLILNTNIALFTTDGRVMSRDNANFLRLMPVGTTNVPVFTIVSSPLINGASGRFFALTYADSCLSYDSNSRLRLYRCKGSPQYAWKIQNIQGKTFNIYNSEGKYIGFDTKANIFKLLDATEKTNFRLTPLNPIKPMRKIILRTSEYDTLNSLNNGLSLKAGDSLWFDMYMGQDVYHNELVALLFLQKEVDHAHYAWVQLIKSYLPNMNLYLHFHGKFIKFKMDLISYQT